MVPYLRHLARAAAGIALLGVAAACADGVGTPTSPAALGTGPNLTEGVGADVTVCKAGGVSGTTYQVSVEGSGGYGWLIYQSPLSLLAGSTNFDDYCKGAWVAGDPASPATALTVTELGGIMPDSILVIGSGAGTYTGTASVTVNVDYFNGALIKFYNPTTPPPPPGGMYGCTPGYWKQSQHFGNWTGYTTGQYYNTVFGVNMLGASTTLLQALDLGGGGMYRLARHSTAALLNAATLGDDYAFTSAEIIAAVQNAVATGNYDVASNAFETENEKGCPLNRAE